MLALTKRSLLTAAAAYGIAPATAAELSAREQTLYDAARKEGELTWYSGQIQAETGEAVGKAFTQRFPGIKVNVVRGTSQVAYQRLSQDMQAGVALCDIFSATDYGHYNVLKREKILVTIPARKRCRPDRRLAVAGGVPVIQAGRGQSAHSRRSLHLRQLRRRLWSRALCRFADQFVAAGD